MIVNGKILVHSVSAQRGKTGLRPATKVLHSEEHLVIKSASADEFQLGDHLIAIPCHACPTSALFEFVDVIDDGVATDRRQIAARNRQLTV